MQLASKLIVWLIDQVNTSKPVIVNWHLLNIDNISMMESMA